MDARNRHERITRQTHGSVAWASRACQYARFIAFDDDCAFHVINPERLDLHLCIHCCDR
jgi:hypothetical protein